MDTKGFKTMRKAAYTQTSFVNINEYVKDLQSELLRSENEIVW